jgi:hypothetical protein
MLKERPLGRDQPNPELICLVCHKTLSGQLSAFSSQLSAAGWSTDG